MQDPRKEKAAALPQTPGVYVMRDREGKVVYVGKAKKLRNRVYQYFANANHPRKVANMVRAAADFEVILTDTELEALVLENQLIKKYKPKYNILLKDDKGYPFIRVDEREEYPRLEVAARRAKDGAKYFGPFGGRGTAAQAIRTIRETLRLPDCSRRFPRDVGKGRPCVRSQIGLCDAPCSGRLGPAEYRARIAEAEQLLQGRDRELVARLTEEMRQASEEMAFERAASLRDRIRAVRALEEKQKIVGAGADRMDVIGAAVSPGGSGIAVLHYSGGALTDKSFFLAPAASEEETGELICEFIARFYTEEFPPPPTVLAARGGEELGLLGEHLRNLAGRQVELSVPERGRRRALAAMACQNALDELSRRAGAERRSGKALEALGELLGLAEPPRRVEAYDISNTGGIHIVAGMVVLRDGRFARGEYRRFRIRSVDHPDDVASVRETVGRRMRDLLEGKAGFSEAPDLLLIDGGQGQTAAAAEAVASLGLSVPVFGMVKDDRHRTRALCDAEGRELSLSAPGVFALVGSLQEEVHRWAVAYHREGRDRRMRSSALDGIPGVGPARKKALLSAFGSVRAIRAASVEELSRHVPEPAARRVYEHFNERNEGSCE